MNPQPKRGQLRPQSNSGQKVFKKPLMPSSKESKTQPPFIQNKKPYAENNDPSVKSITTEKLWSLKNIQLALFIGFALLIIDIVLFYALNTDMETSLIITLTSVVIYAIVLYFLLNPTRQKTIEKEKIKQIEKPTIKVVEKPVVRTIEKPVVKKVASPPITINNDPLKKYPYVASVKSKKIHHTSTTAGRMIRPENREFAHKLDKLKKKGYAEGQVDPKAKPVKKKAAKKAKKSNFIPQ